MAKINSVDQALGGIDEGACREAQEWLESEKPDLVDCVEFLVFKAGWTEKRVLKKIKDTYQHTEQKAQHKIKLVVQMFIRQREDK